MQDKFLDRSLSLNHGDQVYEESESLVADVLSYILSGNENHHKAENVEVVLHRYREPEMVELVRVSSSSNLIPTEFSVVLIVKRSLHERSFLSLKGIGLAIATTSFNEFIKGPQYFQMSTGQLEDCVSLFILVREDFSLNGIIRD